MGLVPVHRWKAMITWSPPIACSYTSAGFLSYGWVPCGCWAHVWWTQQIPLLFSDWLWVWVLSLLLTMDMHVFLLSSWDAEVKLVSISAGLEEAPVRDVHQCQQRPSPKNLSEYFASVLGKKILGGKGKIKQQGYENGKNSNEKESKLCCLMHSNWGDQITFIPEMRKSYF